MFKYKTRGTCSQMILIDADADTIKHVEFIGGCHGNTQGRAGTSCPDQLATALEQLKAQRKEA